MPARAARRGGWLATDALLRLSHLPLSPGFSLAVLLGGAWWLRRPRRIPSARATDVAGWLERLEQLQTQFGRLEEEAAPQRAEQLAGLRAELGRGGLLLALVATSPPPAELQPVLVEALRGPEPLLLHWAHPLPAWSAAWRWPELFEACDGLLHHLRTPLSAADLRWLEALRTLRLTHYAAWLARRWNDPAFPHAFTWFNTERYWADHILELREQMSALQEEPLRLL